jgi:transcriptional regulator with XRE-family HTH domain
MDDKSNLNAASDDVSLTGDPKTCLEAQKAAAEPAQVVIQSAGNPSIGITAGIGSDVLEVNNYVKQWQSGDRSQTLRRAILSVLVRDLRLSLDMNRAELAEITEIPRERILAIEQGTLPLDQLSIGDLGALAGALGPDSRKVLLWVTGRALALAKPVHELAQDDDGMMDLLANDPVLRFARRLHR